MKEILINVIGAFLLVYMVIAVSLFCILIGIVFVVMLIVETLLNLISGMIKGKNIVLRK